MKTTKRPVLYEVPNSGLGAFGGASSKPTHRRPLPAMLSFDNALWGTKPSGLLILRDGAILRNQPQIASDRIIPKKSHNA